MSRLALILMESGKFLSSSSTGQQLQGRVVPQFWNNQHLSAGMAAQVMVTESVAHLVHLVQFGYMICKLIGEFKCWHSFQASIHIDMHEKTYTYIDRYYWNLKAALSLFNTYWRRACGIAIRWIRRTSLLLIESLEPVSTLWGFPLLSTLIAGIRL